MTITYSCFEKGMTFVGVILLVGLVINQGHCQETDARLKRWLVAQDWKRDTKKPVVALGPAKAFDAMHLLSPCVARDKGQYWMWYSGSGGTVARRVFRLGLALSRDGQQFKKQANAVFEFGDGKHSVLTPTVLRSLDGNLLREHGMIRMWFSATDFMDKTGLHTLHETTSKDGIHWSPPTKPLLNHVYAPTILKEAGGYRLWFTDVSKEPWVFRHARSPDGRKWQVSPKPVLAVDQKWEKGRLFYPAVVKADGVYLMWYGSYWSAHANKTALGLAVSRDGLNWFKNPQNPVFRPDPDRPWESHYTTSQSVIRGSDGRWQIWYASRKKPPFLNKYFAIGTARWSGLQDK